MKFTGQEFELGLLLWNAVLGGAPIHAHMASWMKDIRPGHTVIETTGFSQPWENRIGVLLREYDVLVPSEPNEPPFKQHRWVLRTNSHEEFEWHNAAFIRIPTNKHQRDLFKASFASRCEIANCQDCAAEQWVRRDGPGWRQMLRGSRL